MLISPRKVYYPGHPPKGTLSDYIRTAVANHVGDDCLVWPFWKNNKGYGAINLGKNKREYVHRYAYRIAVGEIPPKLGVLHECDNPACFNPRHLKPGSQKDNMQDCKQKRRIQHGERGSNAKLTTTQVKEIRKLCDKGILRRVDIANRYGIGRQTVNAIAWRSSWQHI